MLVDGSNSSKYCGLDNWRVPTIKELENIVNNARLFPTIDTTYFQNTPQYSEYWSASPTAYSSAHAWMVYFGTGYTDYFNVRENTFYLRLVHSEQ